MTADALTERLIALENHVAQEFEKRDGQTDFYLSGMIQRLGHLERTSTETLKLLNTLIEKMDATHADVAVMKLQLEAILTGQAQAGAIAKAVKVSKG